MSAITNPRTRFFLAAKSGIKPGASVVATDVNATRLKQWNSFDDADRVRRPGSIYVTTSSDTATMLAARRQGDVVYEVTVTGSITRDTDEMAPGTAYHVGGTATVTRVIVPTDASTARAARAMGR